MLPNAKQDDLAASVPAAGDECAAPDWRLHRWLVSFRSGATWYDVGEYVALDAATAVAMAVDIFGPAEEHRAQEIPWDAAPLPRTHLGGIRLRS